MSTGLRIVLLGCGLVVLGCFLPAGEPTGFVIIVRDNTLVQGGDGLFMIGGAALAAWLAWGAARSAESTWHIVTLGCVGLANTIWSGATLELTNGETMTPDVGIYVAGLGCVLVAVGGIVLSAENRRHRSMPAADALPEGWMERPDEPGVLRWWDGERWTGATRPADPAEAVTGEHDAVA